MTLVAKIEHLAGCRRAVAAHRHVAPSLGPNVPTLWGSDVPDVVESDEADATGLLLLEDIAPAEQGDELVPTSRQRALDLVAVVAAVHDVAVPVEAPDAEVWEFRALPADRWAMAVDRAVQRYPDVFAGMAGRLRDVHEQALDAAGRLRVGSPAWIHVDPHLDNVLWRPDGSTVLLDWSNSRIGPPEIDLAVLLLTLSFSDSGVLHPDELVDAYAAARRRDATARVDVAERVPLALTTMVRSVGGWVGQQSNDGFHDRKAELRDAAARRLRRALTWLDG